MEGIKKILFMITVEPCVAIFMVGVHLTSLANMNLLLDKSCRVNLGYSDDLCDSLINRNLTDNHIRDADVKVQKYVTEMSSVGKLVQVIIPFITVLLWGLWSDRNSRRKPLILLPIAGELLKNLGLILCVAFRYTNAEVAFAVENVFPLVFGSWTVILLGVYSHVMDTTTEENRTMKVAMSSIFVTIGDPLGSALSGVFLRKFGYYTVFGSSCVMMLIGLIFCVVCVHEVESPTEGSGQSNKPKPSTALLCLDYFNLKDFRTILKVIYRKRSHNKRIMLWVGYSIIIFGLGPNLGHYSVQYLYSRHTFNFTELEYSLFGTITSISGTIGLIVIMFLNTRFLHLNDFGLSMMGLCFGISSSIAFGVSRVARDFYIAGAIDCGFGAFAVSLRAAMMKLVESNEAAKSNAIIGAAEGALYLLFGSLYNLIYSLTVDIFAGTFYFVTTSCYLYSFVAVLSLFFIHRRVARIEGGKSTLTIESAVEK